MFPPTNFPSLAPYQWLGRPTVGISEMQIWAKPRGVTMFHLFCMGSGAGGGGASSVSGYGGGGSGAVMSVLIPACFLPDILYIKTGIGGAGGAAGGNDGSVGQVSFMSISATLVSGTISTDACNFFCCSGATAAVGGNSSGVVAGEVISAQSGGSFPDALLSAMGVVSQVAGVQGASIGSNAGTSRGVWFFNTGGAGGAGANNTAGGQVTVGNRVILPSLGGAAGTPTGVAGSHGISYRPQGIQSLPGPYSMFMNIGGGGGGGGSVTGGRGGDGGSGCGGGGGGLGATTGAVGGRGGHGFTGIWGW